MLKIAIKETKIDTVTPGGRIKNIGDLAISDALTGGTL